MFILSRFCVSSLRRGHANLLCIVPILTVAPKGLKAKQIFCFWRYTRELQGSLWQGTLQNIQKSKNFGGVPLHLQVFDEYDKTDFLLNVALHSNLRLSSLQKKKKKKKESLPSGIEPLTYRLTADRSAD